MIYINLEKRTISGICKKKELNKEFAILKESLQ